MLKLLTNSDDNQKWKTARNGFITLAVLHFIFENAMGNSQSAVFPIAFNFAVAEFFICKSIEDHGGWDNLFLMGITYYSVVFVIRLVIGILFFSLI